MAKAPRKISDQADEVQQESVAPIQAPPAELPALTLKEAFERLKEAENLPALTAADRQAKAHKVASARQICFRLQQGASPVEITADNYAKAHASNADALRKTRIRILARTNQDIAWLISKHPEFKD